MANPINYQFDHVHVYCTDLAASEKWFVNGLGAEVARRREMRGAQAIDLQLGGTKIFLREKQQGEELDEPGSSRFGADHFGLRVDDLDAAAEELKRRGVEFDMEPQEAAPGLRIAFVRGPDRVRVELLQRDTQ
jgi:lactoylglutathione lyase